MSKLGIDVSSYQGNIDWSKVKKSGVEFAILKIIRKDLNPDTRFENNYQNAKACGVDVIGVYNYSYAKSVPKAKEDANKVIQILNGRKVKVWLDVEDESLTKLGASLLMVINAYKDVIESAGLEFGVYTGYAFYNSFIKPYGELKCSLWIARYGTNNGKLVEKYKPTSFGDRLEGWQYTSNGKVNGINSLVDMDIWYTVPIEADKPKTFQISLKGDLNVRKGTSTLSSKTGFVALKGCKLTVLEEKNGWGRVEGWVCISSKYAVRRSNTKAYILREDMNVRSKNSVTSSKLGELVSGPYTFTEVIGNWAYFSGWISLNTKYVTRL